MVVHFVESGRRHWRAECLARVLVEVVANGLLIGFQLALVELRRAVLLGCILPLVLLKLDYLLLDFVEAHQFVELVRYLVEYLQLIFQQTGLLKVANEVNLWWNIMLAVLLLGSIAAIRILRLIKRSSVLHGLLNSCFFLLIALRWQVAYISLIKRSLRSISTGATVCNSQVIQLLLLQLVFVLCERVLELVDQFSHVAHA